MAKMYVYLGVVLALVGSIIALFSYVTTNSVPIMAVGLSTLILGIASIGLANTRPKLSPEACILFLKTGVKNTMAILEELGVKNKAIYLPRSMMKGHSEAIIILSEEGGIKSIREKLLDPLFMGYEVSLPSRKQGGGRKFKEVLPRHIVSEYGTGPKDKVIAVTALGNVSLDLLRRKPGDTADEIKSSMTYILARVLDIAGGINVDMMDNTIKIGVTGAEMMSEEIFYEKTLYYQCLGSPIASIAAAVCSEALNKPVRIAFETFREGAADIVLEVIP